MILVSSYPKSGATWFRFLMYTCQHGEFNKSIHVSKFYPDINKEGVIQEKLASSEEFFVKSHHPYSSEHPFLNNITRCIYIVRNPFDVMLSRLNHNLLHGANLDNEKKANNFFRKFIETCDYKSYEINEKRADGGWNNHVVSWLEENKKIEIFLIKYEDLIENTVSIISDLNDKYQLGFTKENIEFGCEFSSFQNMKKIESNEIELRIPGMFYTEQREKSYMNMGLQFINKKKTNSHMDSFSVEIVKAGMSAFHRGLTLANYNL